MKFAPSTKSNDPSFFVWVKSELTKLKLFRVSVAEDVKCGGCNWQVTFLYALAESQQEADELYKRRDAGLCGSCIADLLVDTGYIIDNEPKKPTA